MKFKFITGLFFVLVLITSCCNNKNQNIEGVWIEADNFIAPTLYKIDKDFISYTYYEMEEKFLYKIRLDTILLQLTREYKKRHFSVNDDFLNIYKPNSDTIEGRLLRYKPGAYLRHTNSSFNMSIDLPDVRGSAINWDGWMKNMLLVDKDTTGKLRLIFNGSEYNIDDNLYAKMMKSNSYYSYAFNCRCFIDRDVSVSELRNIEKELRKANILNVNYITNWDKDSLVGIKYIYRAINFDYPDSIFKNKLPPKPPIIRIDNNFFKKYSLIEITKNEFLLNQKPVSLKQLLEKISPDSLPNGLGRICVYFDDKLNYADYINYLNQIINKLFSNPGNRFYPMTIDNNELAEIKEKAL